MPVTFQYPSNYKTTSNPSISTKVGADPAFVRALVLDEHNVIVVETFELSSTINQKNIGRARSQLGRMLDQIGAEPPNGKPVKYAGFPGFEYALEVTVPRDAQSRVIVLFAGATEVELSCQWTPAQRSDIQRACNQMLSTLQRA